MNTATPTPAPHAALEFRKDINGLRAFAVVAVLLYHFSLGGVTGGFAGVDVFFVISGFLMTGIIINAMDAGRFSLSGFYLARVRRILPALVVLCLAVLAFGWFWLAPYLYENLGRSAGSSLLFISNSTYNRGGGYFAPNAHDNWLLHTWSVSVEWQFYLLYPMLLLGIAKFAGGSRRVLIGVLSLLLLSSFAFCVYQTAVKPTSAFFLLPSRTWELLAGGLVFLCGKDLLRGQASRIAELTGFAMIIASLFMNDSSTAWPGHRAALPVIGTCLILLAARTDSFWTGNPVAQGLGRWSYSIYLWHWPLVVGMGYFAVRDDSRWVIAVLAASIVLGALSYSLIEQPAARLMRNLGTRGSWAFAGAGFSVAFAIAALAYFDHGVARTYRLPAEVLAAAHEKENTGQLTKCNTAESQCVLGNGDVIAVVWGDSHSISAVSGVAEAARKAGGSVLFFGQQACPVIFDARSGARNINVSSPDYCRNFNDMVFARLSKIAPTTPVVIINRAGAYMEPGDRLMYFGDRVPENAEERRAVFEQHMVDSLCRIAATRPVHVLLPLPQMPWDVPAVVSRSLILTGEAQEPSQSIADYRKANGHIIAAMQRARDRCGIKLLDPVPQFCSAETCVGIAGGVPLYSDDNHLSETGAHRLAPLFAEIWKTK